MLFYQIGELFQSIAVGKSRKNIADLMDICPEIANVFHEDGTITEEDPDDVEIGSIIVVNPGERVPIDGIIIEGDTSLDTSALTGESVPRAAHPDDEIISGCISLTGMINSGRELYLKVCQVLYAYRMLFGAGVIPASACCKAYPGNAGKLD